MGDNVYLWKKHSEIGVFLESNLIFTTRVGTLGLANDLTICKKLEKPAMHVILI